MYFSLLSVSLLLHDLVTRSSQMDVHRCRCLVKLFPEMTNEEVKSDGEMEYYGTRSTLLHLLLRPEFILTFRVVEVASFPDYWSLVQDVVANSQSAHSEIVTDLGNALAFMLRVTDNLVTLISRFLVDKLPFGAAFDKHVVHKMYPVDEWIAISPTAAKLYAQRRQASFVFAPQTDVRRALNEWTIAFIDLYTEHESPRSEHVNSIIHTVASFTNVDGLSTLLKHLGDVAFPDDKGRTALHLIACRGMTRAMKQLTN